MGERLRALRGHPTFLRFLAALFFYMNALDTVYVFAAIFANATLGFSTRDSIVLLIVMNVVAAPGAWLAGRVAGRIGAKRTIELTLVLWLVAIAAAVVAAWPGILALPARQTLFWGVAVLASLCIGGTQATSRTLVGQIAPAGQSGEFFGLMAFAGRASAIVGPLVFGVVSDATGEQRWAVASIGAFFLVGLVLMRRVPSTLPPLASS
jgi:UMF1 family MFS transporter